MVHDIAKNDYTDSVPQVNDIDVISSRHPEAELIKVFVHANEKERLKNAVANKNTSMSHLARALLLQWLEVQGEGGMNGTHT
ncbi:MAG: hypothetical protein HC874_25650 [Richelia sp. SL_2_1]|nr:hypothetical protein [Richelia sp. RM1_1_1]NJO30547.1 hypothetical protein [Richelia sp. SL_2_1]